jgi:diguanylate cyclase (GGDEF)-like protein
MSVVDLKPQIQSEFDYRRAILSLRWLLVILAAYLTLFSYLGSELFPFAAATAMAFALTNIGLSVVPRPYFGRPAMQRLMAGLDGVFVGATFYLLRVPETYFYLAFFAIFVLALFWRDFRLVLFSLLVVSVLFGVFNYFRIFRLQLDVYIERFLTLALFFVVAIFYVFLSERLKLDATLSHAILEENRIAEVMVEMSRTLSSSLNTDDVLFAIASKLRENLQAQECSIVKVEPNSPIAKVMVKASDSLARDGEININEHPELREAFENRKLVVVAGPDLKGIIALPMITQETVQGLIWVQGPSIRRPLSAAMVRFLEITGSTAANALRNAQLFEEVQHRARTDSLTGLPNHNYFQATLAIELARSERHDHPLSLLMIDLDYLKTINDRFGHPSGDLVIRTIAQTLRDTTREIDFAARYGGEEFVVILPETDLPGAVQVAERIRGRIADIEFKGIGTISASIGVACRPVNALTKEDMIRIADQALYVAKDAGRDRVAFFNYQMITK